MKYDSMKDCKYTKSMHIELMYIRVEDCQSHPFLRGKLGFILKDYLIGRFQTLRGIPTCGGISTSVGKSHPLNDTTL